MGWSIFGEPKRPSEPEMLTFAEQIAAPLKVQLDLAASMSGQGQRLVWNPAHWGTPMVGRDLGGSGC